jgi:CDP-diacylglycerol--glycerol-3-phosphate 3-phosphatidyltransferase
MKLHYTGKQADWDLVPAENRNVWQRLAARTSGVVTPGNAVSLLGIVLVLSGLAIMSANEFWWGFGVLALGRIADIVDGTIANSTGTKSPVGEAVDAIFDKIAAIAVLVFFVYYQWIPIVPMLLVALHVCANSILALTARIRHVELHPTAAGKISTVGAWAILLVFPAATAVDRLGWHSAQTGLMAFGYVLTVVFAALATQAVRKYYQDATVELDKPGLATIVFGLTGLRIACAAVIIIAAVAHLWTVVFVLALAAFITDYYDGWLARRWQVVSTFGMAFDPLADKVVCLTMLGIAAVYVTAWYWVLFAVFVAYDTFTMTMRFVRPVPMPASKAAKVKTALLMVGLLVMVAGIHGGILAWAAGGLLIVAAVLTLRSFVGYTRAIGRSLTWLEHTPGVTAIDFAAWHKDHGITTVLFDIDGTLTPWNVVHVEDVVISAVQEAKKAGIAHVGLVSNMRAKRLERLASIAEQVGASTYHLPQRPDERKPSSKMIYAALEKIGGTPEQTGFVGDKIVDVLAAQRAGLARMAWVDRLGTADHMIEKIFYRPIERFIKWAIR